MKAAVKWGLAGLTLALFLGAGGTLRRHFIGREAVRQQAVQQAWDAFNGAVDSLRAEQIIRVQLEDSLTSLIAAYDKERTKVRVLSRTQLVVKDTVAEVPAEVVELIQRCDSLAAAFVPYRAAVGHEARSMQFVVKAAEIVHRAERAADPSWLARTWEAVDQYVMFVIGGVTVAAIR